MKKFRCSKCEYEFSPRTKGKEEIPHRCPYCGKDGSVQEKGHILQEL